MAKIRGSELISILGDGQLRSLGFVLNARGRWLRKNAPTSKRSGPLSPRPAGVMKRPRCCNGPKMVGSRGSSPSGSCDGSSRPPHRPRTPLCCGNSGRHKQPPIPSSSRFLSPKHASHRSGPGRWVAPSPPDRRQRQTPSHSAPGNLLGAVVPWAAQWTSPRSVPEHVFRAIAPAAAHPIRAAHGTAATPERRSIHQTHVPPIPVGASPDGFSWPRSGLTSSSLSPPFVAPQPFPRMMDDPSRTSSPVSQPWAQPGVRPFPWTQPGVRPGETASGSVVDGSDEGHDQTDGDSHDGHNLTGGSCAVMSVGSASASRTSSSSLSSVVSVLSFDDQWALHNALPHVFPRPGVSPTPTMQAPEPLAHLPMELRLEIVNELGPADMLALRRAYPVAFGFIYGEDARYQRLYNLERRAAKEAERSWLAAERGGAISPESLTRGRRRLQQLRSSIRPQRESLLRYAIDNGYPADEIETLVRIYLANNIDLAEIGL